MAQFTTSAIIPVEVLGGGCTKAFKVVGLLVTIMTLKG
jgi:hypothetical protein